MGEGKLNLIYSNEHSGGLSGVPRNTGIRFSRGEYLWFIDSDDVIVENALEELNAFIKNFDVDIVYCVKHYRNFGEFSLKDKSGLTAVSTDDINEPMFMSDNLKDRMDKFCATNYMPFSWNQIFKRSFISQNNITFPPIRCGTDCFFGFYAVCLARKILCIPNLWYVWRQTNPNSITKAQLLVEQRIHRWVDSLFKGVGIMDKFMNKIDFFCENPKYKYAVYELLIYHHANCLIPLYDQIPAWELDELIRRELDEVKDQTALMAFLFNRMNDFNVRLNKQHNLIQEQQKIIQQLQTQLQKFI